MTSQHTNDNNHRMKQILDLLEQQPTDSFLLHALALENMKLTNWEEAKNIFIRLLDYNPNYVGSYFHLASTYQFLKQNDKAINTYEEGIKIAQQQKDFHSLNELRSAMDDLLDEAY
jgi:Tfp pilus assembly protein PilF